MEDSVFTKIIKGEIPGYKVYEDDKTFCILDIHPVQPGHTLVIPKKQVEFLWDLDDETFQAVMNTAKKVAKKIREVMMKPYVGVKVEGIGVPHTHVHLIPFSKADEFHKVADLSSEPDHESLSEVLKRLAF